MFEEHKNDESNGYDKIEPEDKGSEHSGSEQRGSEHKESCCSSTKPSTPSTWNGFQKFLSVVVVLNLLLSFYIISQLSGNGSAGNGATGAVVGNQPSPGLAQPSAPTQPPAPVVDMKQLVDDDAVRGSADAKVTIVEFSDYECPFCERFYTQTYGQLKTEYIDTGKVKFIYRDFPLSFHPQAQKAAEAAECAGEQGKYYEMHDLLFEKGVADGVQGFKAYAQELGLDTTKFNDCLDSGAMGGEVRKDMNDGSRAGVRGTPAFFINGQLLSGAQPIEAFRQVIDAELN